MLIRDALPADWAAIWRFMQPIVAAGETFAWDRDLTQERARSIWLENPHGRPFVAVDDDAAVVGTAEVHRNQGGPGAHVGNAGFMVDPACAGRGVGRALCEHSLRQARADGYRSMQFNAVVETNVRAVKLWQSLGFDILTTVPEAFHHPTLGYVGLHVMFKRL